jgi:hypothetical protein
MKKFASTVVANVMAEPVIGFAELIVVAVVLTLLFMPL